MPMTVELVYPRIDAVNDGAQRRPFDRRDAELASAFCEEIDHRHQE
jgi:hypothetical protein